MSTLGKAEVAALPRVAGSVVALYQRRTSGDDEANVFVRKSLQAATVGAWGLDGSNDWHRYCREKNPAKYKKPMPERAVLCQSHENYAELARQFPTTASLTPGQASFGENVEIRGLSAADLCIGDVFTVQAAKGGPSTLRLQVTCPRKPCNRVDRKNACAFGLQGVRFAAATQCLGGWFLSVLEEGEVRVGDRLVLAERLHPRWPLPHLTDLMYGKTNAKFEVAWHGTDQERRELCAMPELAGFEWKDDLAALAPRTCTGALCRLRDRLCPPNSNRLKTT